MQEKKILNNFNGQIALASESPLTLKSGDNPLKQWQAI